ncbi:TIGR03643 family protein [Pseudoalteromonas sp. NEC-BIFX-2020_015]|uniref:TIGR03643 family protein n=1 Tax=Pseudoalteromonas sp. NEC-BIFX-2020_015 TaxID=2729544 RepID=UPI00146138F1|nr:TIGR03643 family protein [Pseudoalteromonas sp. NEC-BIFX-2020_015]NMR24848.1 TIGR03643 family protein [Pseudoalteromonas sp. NEC-BIFX-2020_015]
MQFSDSQKSRIIEMAWEDRTPFEAIENLYSLNHSQLVGFMRSNVSAGSFKVWRKRHAGRTTKHLKLRDPAVMRSHCKTQYKNR